MAKYINGQHLNNLKKTDLVFWTKGNYPTQKIGNLTYNIVINHLKLLYLLSEKIVASSSFYFESPITQQVTDTLEFFFNEGDILYFFDDDLENPTEHAKKKISKSPKGLSPYQDQKAVLRKAQKIETFGDNLLRRPNHSISDKMVDLWIEEVSSTKTNSIGDYIFKEISNNVKQKEIKDALISFAINRDKDFVWDYIKPILTFYGLSNPYFHEIIKSKLAQMYSFATASVLGVELDESLNNNFINKNSKYDTTLFSKCLSQLGILELIYQLENEDLKKLKTDTHFAIFRDFYFKMIEDCESKTENIIRGIDTFSKIENSKQSSISKKDFVDRFIEYRKLSNYPKRKFSKRLDEIKLNLENFNSGIVNIFVSTVQNFNIDNPNKDLFNKNIEFKLKEYKRKSIKTVLLYFVFCVSALLVVIVDNKLTQVLSYKLNCNYINFILAIILASIPIIDSFIKHEKVIKAFSFLFTKSEKIKVKKEFEIELKKKT